MYSQSIGQTKHLCLNQPLKVRFSHWKDSSNMICIHISRAHFDMYREKMVGQSAAVRVFGRICDRLIESIQNGNSRSILGITGG